MEEQDSQFFLCGEILQRDTYLTSLARHAIMRVQSLLKDSDVRPSKTPDPQGSLHKVGEVPGISFSHRNTR